MFRTINDFDTVWSQELESTQKILKHLTDKSLTQAGAPGGRTIGRMAWHIVISIPEMMTRTGLKLEGPQADAPLPASSKQIFSAYNDAAVSLLKQIKAQWSDATLSVIDDMYGEKWARGKTLAALVFHQIHHRAQMTVLMRQAGLSVPGVFGPAREEWAQYGMNEPEI